MRDKDMLSIESDPIGLDPIGLTPLVWIENMTMINTEFQSSMASLIALIALIALIDRNCTCT